MIGDTEISLFNKAREWFNLVEDMKIEAITENVALCRKDEVFYIVHRELKCNPKKWELTYYTLSKNDAFLVFENCLAMSLENKKVVVNLEELGIKEI